LLTEARGMADNEAEDEQTHNAFGRTLYEGRYPYADNQKTRSGLGSWPYVTGEADNPLTVATFNIWCNGPKGVCREMVLPIRRARMAAIGRELTGKADYPHVVCLQEVSCSLCDLLQTHEWTKRYVGPDPPAQRRVGAVCPRRWRRGARGVWCVWCPLRRLFLTICRYTWLQSEPLAPESHRRSPTQEGVRLALLVRNDVPYQDWGDVDLTPDDASHTNDRTSLRACWIKVRGPSLAERATRVCKSELPSVVHLRILCRCARRTGWCWWPRHICCPLI
jgi:hypothetical protein